MSDEYTTQQLQDIIDSKKVVIDGLRKALAARNDLLQRRTDQYRTITKLGKRLKMMQQANKALAAHNFTLVTLQADRGINCERIIRGDRAEAKLARIRELAIEWDNDEIMGVIDAE